MNIGLATFKQRQLNEAVTIALLLTEHANIFLNTYLVTNTLNYHCCCIVTWQLLAANSKLVENFEQAASTRCSGDNKEKLSTNIRSEYASDFCHDRKSALRD